MNHGHNIDCKEEAKKYLQRTPFLYALSRNIYRFIFQFRHFHYWTIEEQLGRTLEGKGSVYFIQVGSNDGLRGDPLHKFIVENKAWAGIFIEPLNAPFQRLKRNYGCEGRFIFENVAIGAERGRRKFYSVPEVARHERNDLPFGVDQLSSFDRGHILKHQSGRFEPFIVEENIQCVTLKDVLDKHHVRAIDLLHIDAEGFDYKVLAQVDFERYRPLVILYEHVHLTPKDNKRARLLLESQGYRWWEYDCDTLALLKSTRRGP